MEKEKKEGTANENGANNARIIHLAELLKAISHPVRLCIVKRLWMEGACNVGYFTDCMEISQSGISQHLSKLRTMGIVETEKRGAEVYYSLVDNDIIKIIQSIF